MFLDFEKQPFLPFTNVKNTKNSQSDKFLKIHWSFILIKLQVCSLPLYLKEGSSSVQNVLPVLQWHLLSLNFSGQLLSVLWFLSFKRTSGWPVLQVLDTFNRSSHQKCYWLILLNTSRRLLLMQSRVNTNYRYCHQGRFLNLTKWLLLVPLRLSVLCLKQSENTKIQKIHSPPENLSCKPGKSEEVARRCSVRKGVFRNFAKFTAKIPRAPFL